MSGATTRMTWTEADHIARRFVDHIQDACDQVVIAGSLRRNRPTVGDIEVVAVPSLRGRQADLFGEVTERVDLLDDLLTQSLSDGIVQQRRSESGATAWGMKHKRIVFEGAPVDVFCADADRLGVILAIRTGPAHYSHALVSPKGLRIPGTPLVGMLPGQYRVQGGSLTYRVSGQPIPTPTERGFFELIGVPYQDPHLRGTAPTSGAFGGV
jgi:DNA polymerase/3'-5' exonuclease PolX